MKFRTSVLWLLFALIFVCLPLTADTVNFYGPTDQNFGTTTHVFGTGSTSITALGFQGLNPGSPSNLYSKGLGNGSGELGLGLASDPNHEINGTQFIELDFSSFSAGSALSIEIQSVQSGESFTICQGAAGKTSISNGTTTCAATGLSLLGTHTGPPTIWDISFNLANGKALYITGGGAAGGENVTVASVSTAPEPSSIMLLGTGFLSAAGIIRRKRLGKADRA